MLGQAFQSIAILLQWQDTEDESWHCSAIDGHSILADGTPILTPVDSRILQDNGLITVSQLYEESVTGTLSRTVNSTLIDRLASNQQWLRPKLRALTNTINNQWLSVTNKYVLNSTTGSLMIRAYRHLSQVYRKAKAEQARRDIQTAPAYATRIRDGIYHPGEGTFQDAYKVLDIPELPSKTKESAFEVLNRTIWTDNKAHKSGLIDSPCCERCEETETMEHLLPGCTVMPHLFWSHNVSHIWFIRVSLWLSVQFTF